MKLSLPVRAAARALPALALGGLMLYDPVAARTLLRGTLWLPPCLLAACGIFMLRPRSRVRWYGAAALAAGLALGFWIWRTGANRQAVLGAAMLLALAAADLARHAVCNRVCRWSTAGAGVLSAMLAGLLVLRRNSGFIAAADLLGVFFLALGVLLLTVAAHPRRSAPRGGGGAGGRLRLNFR